MPAQDKYNRILDALMTLLENNNIQSISVSEIASTAGQHLLLLPFQGRDY